MSDRRAAPIGVVQAVGRHLIRHHPNRYTIAAAAALVALAASLSWSARQLERQVEARGGWRQTFYAAPDFSGPPRVERRVPAIDLSIIDTEAGLPRGNFSIRWEGVWDLPAAGTIDLYAGGDDELYVHVNDERVHERSLAAGMATVARRLVLPAGLHRIRIDYIQRAGGAYANVLWAPADREPRPFRLSEIFPGEPDARTLSMARLASTRERVGAIVGQLAALVVIALLAVPLAAHGWGRLGGPGPPESL